MKCFLYIMQSGRGKNPPIKIGVSSNPERRIMELQPGNPHLIKLLIKIPMPSRRAAYDLETYMHKRFRTARMEGEWFYSKGCNIKSALKRYHYGDISDKKQSVGKKQVCGNKSGSKLRKLEAENWKLREQARRLEEDIDSYLDSKIDLPI